MWSLNTIKFHCTTSPIGLDQDDQDECVVPSTLLCFGVHLASCMHAVGTDQHNTLKEPVASGILCSKVPPTGGGLLWIGGGKKLTGLMKFVLPLENLKLYSRLSYVRTDSEQKFSSSIVPYL